MGKRKQLVKELEAALAQMEQDWRIEHENAGLMERNMLRNIAEQVSERKHYAMVVDAKTKHGKRHAAADAEIVSSPLRRARCRHARCADGHLHVIPGPTTAKIAHTYTTHKLAA